MNAAVELTGEAPIRTVCSALGVSRSTLLRRRRGPCDRLTRAIRCVPRALSAVERAQVLAVLHSERFVDRAPATIHAILLDEGRYLCSVSTMYRLLQANAEVQERRRVPGIPNIVNRSSWRRVHVKF